MTSKFCTTDVCGTGVPLFFDVFLHCKSQRTHMYSKSCASGCDFIDQLGNCKMVSFALNFSDDHLVNVSRISNHVQLANGSDHHRKLTLLKSSPGLITIKKCLNFKTCKANCDNALEMVHQKVLQHIFLFMYRQLNRLIGRVILLLK